MMPAVSFGGRCLSDQDPRPGEGAIRGVGHCFPSRPIGLWAACLPILWAVGVRAICLLSCDVVAPVPFSMDPSKRDRLRALAVLQRSGPIRFPKGHPAMRLAAMGETEWPNPLPR